MQELAEKIELLKKEIDAIELKTADEIENYRIRFLGSKGLVKQLMSEMKKNVSRNHTVSEHC